MGSITKTQKLKPVKTILVNIYFIAVNKTSYPVSTILNTATVPAMHSYNWLFPIDLQQ